jgi:hypothetical protein
MQPQAAKATVSFGPPGAMLGQGAFWCDPSGSTALGHRSGDPGQRAGRAVLIRRAALRSPARIRPWFP